jgi:hypothetical protein|tara:strand:+ start:137 stop:496 length:360 start_codon:yes stop_codon:yes gene_type:complete
VRGEDNNTNKEREKRVLSSSIMGGRVSEHRGEERTALLAKNKGDFVNENGDRHRRGKIGGAMMMMRNDAEGESTFHYLSSIVVSALALTGAVIGVESVWQRCKSGNCNPGSFLLPGDHR